MGKENRKAEQEAKLLAAQKKQQQQSEAAKKQKRNRILGIVATVLVVVLLGSLMTYNKLVSSGYFMRRTVSASTENYEMDNAVVSYFFNGFYQQFINQYSSSTSYLGLNTNKSLKSQACSMLQSGGTWFDYFMSTTKTTLTRTLVFCEEAKARGLALDDNDYKLIDDAIASLRDAAKKLNVSKTYYIHAMYGAGVSEKDVRRALEMSALYAKGYNALVETYSFTEADYETYKSEHENELLHVSYATMSMTTSDAAVDGDITVEMLKEYSERFAAAKDKVEFDGIAFDYLRNCSYKNNSTKTDDDIREEIDGFTTENASYAEDSEFFTWAFDKSRRANDVYTTQNDDGTAQYVYILLSPAALDETKTVNVRHILLSADTCGSDEKAQAKAEELLATWKNGAATAESFAALAEENSEDTGSNTNGGLYENVGHGDMVDEFDTWLFADGRAAGDTGIVKSDYGYHVMYLDSFGLTAWEAQADSALKNAKYTEDYAALTEKYPVTFDDAKLYEIDA